MKTFLFTLFALLLVPFAHAQQTSAPAIKFRSVPDFFKLPSGMNFGEVPGVAVDSKGNVYVFTRSNSAGGPAYGAAAAQLLEFSPGASSFGRSVKASTVGRRRTACGS